MAELSSIARPYAQAVFELAKDSGHYGPWSEALEFLATVAADKDMAALFSNPRVSRQQAADIVIELLGEVVGDEPKNLVRLLAQNRRLQALSDISEQYKLLLSPDNLNANRNDLFQWITQKILQLATNAWRA